MPSLLQRKDVQSTLFVPLPVNSLQQSRKAHSTQNLNIWAPPLNFIVGKFQPNSEWVQAVRDWSTCVKEGWAFLSKLNKYLLKILLQFRSQGLKCIMFLEQQNWSKSICLHHKLLIIVSFYDDITYETCNRDLPLNFVHRYTYDMHTLNTQKDILTYSKNLKDLHMVKGKHERPVLISLPYTLSLFSIGLLKMKG